MLSAKSYLNQFWSQFRLTNIAFQDSTDKTTSSQLVICWTPPSFSYMKLNVHGAWRGLTDTNGGWIITCHDGSWFVGFSAKFLASSPLAAELMALKEGIEMAKEFKINFLIIEMDALELKSMFIDVEHNFNQLQGIESVILLVFFQPMIETQSLIPSVRLILSPMCLLKLDLSSLLRRKPILLVLNLPMKLITRALNPILVVHLIGTDMSSSYVCT